MFQISDCLSEVSDMNLKDICRLCRTAKGVMSYIYGSPGVDTSVPLSIRIMKFANIKMCEGDGLPSLICHRCLYHIEKANEFKEQCEQSDALLRRFVAHQMEDSRHEDIKPCHLTSSTGVQCDDIARAQAFFLESGIHLKQEDDDPDVENVVMVVDPNQTLDESDEHNSENEFSELTCPSCNKAFDSNEGLSRHLNIHTQDGPFPCDYCEAVLNDKATLKAHWRQFHAEDKPYLCLTCGEAFAQRESLTDHTTMHNKVKPFHCTEPTCNKAFAYRSDLRKHSVIHTGVRPYVCPVCYKSFTRSTNLNKHARLHTGRRPFSCEHCNKMFASRGDLVRHSVIHTGEKPYSCAICSLSFNRKDKLSRHEKLHKGERAHACSECPTSFHRKEELTKHIQFHHYQPGMFDDEDFSDSKGTSPHSLNGKDDGSEPPKDEENEESITEEKGECETEDMIISVDPSHWAETKCQCEVCHKVVGDPGELSRHRSIHNKSRDFVCEICCKGFHQRRELVRHSMTHTGFKPHTCEVCGKAFSRRDKLTRHTRIHLLNKEGPLSLNSELERTCEVCSKVYSSKHELSRHMMTHSLHRPYQCSQCSSSYCRKDKLVKHIKTVHPESCNHTQTS